MSHQRHENENIANAEHEAARVTAYALDQLDALESAEVDALLASDNTGAVRRQVADVWRVAAEIAVATNGSALAHSPQLLAAIETRLDEVGDFNREPTVSLAPKPKVSKKRRRLLIAELAVWGCWIALIAALFLPAPQRAREAARSKSRTVDDPNKFSEHFAKQPDPTSQPSESDMIRSADIVKRSGEAVDSLEAIPGAAGNGTFVRRGGADGIPNGGVLISNGQVTTPGNSTPLGMSGVGEKARMSGAGGMPGMPGAGGMAGMSGAGGMPGMPGNAGSPGMPGGFGSVSEKARILFMAESRGDRYESELRDRFSDGSEQYDKIIENAFLPVDREHALSTLSIDVDTASYSNVRRFLMEGRRPPAGAVRIEELLNYFSYHYPQPTGDVPFSVNMEVTDCPWRTGHRLVRIGLKGREVPRAKRPASNLVFLIDVSGSMADANKLPLVKQAMKMLAGELTENDRVAIVTYAGESGLALESTNATNKEAITQAIDRLTSGGSTNGSAGIQLAYETATQHFIRGGTNRVILATDGDLNVGVTDDDALVRLIKDEASSGVFLTVLSVGTGNLKDSKLEKLADNGNGTYAYLDSLREARRVLVEQISASLVTIAKDVKLQVEFNPVEVQSYRLIGYENRVLATQDFHDDRKDAGEIGAGHTVTALYEIVLAGGPAAATDGLKYQPTAKSAVPTVPNDAARNGELLTLKLRYKKPDEATSRLLEHPLRDAELAFSQASKDTQFAAAVAAFGLILRGSQHAGSATLSGAEEIGAASLDDDIGGYRSEFLDLVRRAQPLVR